MTNSFRAILSWQILSIFQFKAPHRNRTQQRSCQNTSSINPATSAVKNNAKLLFNFFLSHLPNSMNKDDVYHGRLHLISPVDVPRVQKPEDPNLTHNNKEKTDDHTLFLGSHRKIQANTALLYGRHYHVKDLPAGSISNRWWMDMCFYISPSTT